LGSEESLTPRQWHFSATVPPIPLRERLALFARDIKIAHTIFAMPFALLATFLAAGGHPRVGQLALILLCMVAARTVAMASNRLLDAKLDALNPRTAKRAIPAGLLSRTFVITLAVACGLAFIASTAGFLLIYHNAWPLIFSLPVLIYISAYPFMKRFTRFCHYYLGGALALAPVCAWLAIAGTIAWPPIFMALAVLTWTAGFDIIYACQDYESDLQTGVISVPSKLGIPRALWVARFTHVFSATMLIALGLTVSQLGLIYMVGVGIACGLLIVEHAVVRPNDLSKVGLAFFTINGMISMLIGALGIIDIYC